MLDFVQINTELPKKGVCVVSPEFLVVNSKDLMTRGKGFYAIWDEEKGMWSRDEYDVVRKVDGLVKDEVRVKRGELGEDITIKPKYLRNSSTKKFLDWQTYAKALPDNYHELDTKITFANTEVKKEDYVSMRLDYPLKEGTHESYDTLMNTLYDEKERDKLEWAIGAIISGDSKRIQKFVVLYGSAGSGKSTVLNIIQELFDGYYSVFEAKALASSTNAFALEPFKNNPLVAIQHDGDLSRIEDNTKLNSIVSHETMVVNEKHRSLYSMRFNSFLFMGTNKPVKITEAKSGIIRRLIDVTPSGRKIPFSKYQALMNCITFEKGAIAYHCLEKYRKMGENYYDKYKPVSMIGATNDFYNFVEDNYEFFIDPEGVTLDAAWTEYKKYCLEANVAYPYAKRAFKEELKNYFTDFLDRYKGRYKVYSGFRKEKFDYVTTEDDKIDSEGMDGGLYSLSLDHEESIFDEIYKDCPAQLTKEGGSPEFTWENVKTKLKDIDTTKLHYVLVPENLIVIDFDIKDADGKKDPVANLEAASKWPPTYAEFSKGGGIHLHYIYTGDVLSLSRVYDENIEVKVFKKTDGTRGYSSLRRKLSKCNNLPIATLDSGLPLKGAKNVVNFEEIKSERSLRNLIERNLRKEIHGATAPSVDFIKKILDDAYNGQLSYDVRDLRPAVLSFASKSTHQSGRCIDQVAAMHFASKDQCESVPDSEYNDAPIIFFDVEVFSNLLVICWKYEGTPRDQTVKMINPSPEDVKKLFKYRLIGFNNRRYDNHILYAASMGYSNAKIYEISQGIISSGKDTDRSNYFFGAAYGISYADIYDYASKKQSLKKWEIELGIHHQELGLPWDEPAPEELWDKVADYCVNDVVATEALYSSRKCQADLATRKLLADLSGLTVNDPNRLHITKILVGDDPNPKHVYTDLATGKQISDGPLPPDNGLINKFPGYEMTWDENGKPHNMYRGTDVGFGGYVYAEPGMYKNVALLDVGNMHGASINALNKFGEHTKNYTEIRSARMAVKRKDFVTAKKLLNGKLTPMVERIEAISDEAAQAEAIDNLQGALKLILNSTYGIAAATFKNPLRDPRDKNNIIALRGALFMRTLQDEVVKKGYKVIGIRTDSIKVPDATPHIINFIIDFGKKYGYEFEHECTYEKLCLVNNAVYIAKYDNQGIRNKGGKKAGKWSATGAQFAQPYVFKTLFSKEPIDHEDLCETKETSKGMGLYLDMNEGLPADEHDYHYVGKVGQFCPIKAGHGGGILVRELNGKMNAPTGTKKPSYDKASGEEPVYRWLESEVVENLNKWDDVDHSYYRTLVDQAVADISKFGDFEWFVSDDPVPSVVDDSFINVPEDSPEEVEFV